MTEAAVRNAGAFRGDRRRRSVGRHARIHVPKTPDLQPFVYLPVALKRQIAVGSIFHIGVGLARLGGGYSFQI